MRVGEGGGACHKQHPPLLVEAIEIAILVHFDLDGIEPVLTYAPHATEVAAAVLVYRPWHEARIAWENPTHLLAIRVLGAGCVGRPGRGLGILAGVLCRHHRQPAVQPPGANARCSGRELRRMGRGVWHKRHRSQTKDQTKDQVGAIGHAAHVRGIVVHP